MIKDFIFVHGGISSNLLNYDNIVTANEDLMKYINDPSNITFDEASINNSNLLTLSPMSDDGLVMDRFFGFKKEDITEEEMCTSLYNKFKSLCRELVNEYKNYSEIELNKYSNLPSFPVCNPNNMKLVIGHCNQNDVTNEQNKIYKSTFRTLISSNSIDSFPYNEEYGKSVVTDETESSKGIYGITTSCGNRDTNLVIDKNNPSIFRIDVGMARGFNSREYSETYLYSRSPQVLKIDYNDLFTPTITIVKSTFKNSLVHLKDWGVNPYTKKYLKYKNKYLQLKKMKNNLI